MLLKNVVIPSTDASHQEEWLWDVNCVNGSVKSIVPASNAAGLSPTSSVSEDTFDAAGGILLPSLCHPHVHLDKCFLLERHHPLETGTFQEAMDLTSKAKSLFPSTRSDLLERGNRLIAESISAGVTSLRAHVEVDSIVGMTCIEVGLELKEKWAGRCKIQIAAFAQEPLFASPDALDPGDNYCLLQEALRYVGVEVVGSAPYVEPNTQLAKRNIELLTLLACENSLALDFHLDYNMDERQEPLVYHVVSELEKLCSQPPDPLTRSMPVLPKSLVLGHLTRLSLLSDSEWRLLADRISALKVPVSLVALPQSDLYMIGRRPTTTSSFVLGPSILSPRAILPLPFLVKPKDEGGLGLRVSMGINNIQNAFTPQGSADPLTSLCPLAVAIWQTARAADLKTFFRAVSVDAHLSMKPPTDDTNQEQSDIPNYKKLIGTRADFVIIRQAGNSEPLSLDQVFSRVVLNPPHDRTTIFGGKVVATRRSAVQILDP